MRSRVGQNAKIYRMVPQKRGTGTAGHRGSKTTGSLFLPTAMESRMGRMYKINLEINGRAKCII